MTLGVVIVIIIRQLQSYWPTIEQLGLIIFDSMLYSGLAIGSWPD
jgi:hypothetical protein